MSSMRSEVAKIFLMRNSAKYWINKLGLAPHPEGGFFKEVYRCSEFIQRHCLPGRYTGSRPFSTSIYYLLEKGDKSAFHRLKSDETWFFHDGEELELYVLNETGNTRMLLLGLNYDTGSLPQQTVFRNSWLAAKPKGEYSLVSCHVAPGFDFDDFELADYKPLKDKIPPAWADLIAD